MVVIDRDQYKKKLVLCVSQEVVMWGEVVISLMIFIYIQCKVQFFGYIIIYSSCIKNIGLELSLEMVGW